MEYEQLDIFGNWNRVDEKGKAHPTLDYKITIKTKNHTFEVHTQTNQYLDVEELLDQNIKLVLDHADEPIKFIEVWDAPIFLDHDSGYRLITTYKGTALRKRLNRV